MTVESLSDLCSLETLGLLISLDQNHHLTLFPKREMVAPLGSDAAENYPQK